MQNILESLTLAQENYAGSYMGILRYAVPVLSAILLLRCVLPLLTFRREPEIWAWLNMTDGSQIPITHWENVIGRSKSSDVTIDFPTVSRNHAVLTRYDDGSWTITDAGSKDGTLAIVSCSPPSRKPSSIRHCKMDSTIRFATLSQPLAALVRSSA